MRCAIGWQAFGLVPEPDCTATATVEVMAACVHEHVARSPACNRCAGYMRSLTDPSEWWCGPCFASGAGHACPAPLVMAAIANGKAHG